MPTPETPQRHHTHTTHQQIRGALELVTTRFWIVRDEPDLMREISPTYHPQPSAPTNATDNADVQGTLMRRLP
eukprot:scaffold467731_cov16-Prasinocladus_malaysianus.AAC.1